MESEERSRCRLCAKSYLSDEIVGQIDNESLEIEIKLIACCQWVTLNHPKSEELSKNVCISCFQELQQSWDFAERIRNAQFQLLSQLINANKLEKESDDSQDISSNKSENSRDLGEFDTNSDSELNRLCSFGDVNTDSIVQTTNFKTDDNSDSDIETKQILVSENDNLPLIHNIKHEELVAKQSISNANNFLNAISEDDRNDDGTIKPEAIERLKLGNWTLLQHQCYLCPLQFSDYSEWRDHILTEHPEKPFKHACIICDDKVYSTREPLKRHIANNHQRHLKYCCRKCNRYFWDLQCKRRHSAGCKAIVQDILSLCDICGKEFKSQPLLRFHRKFHLLNIKPTYECFMCKKSFSTKNYLKYHIQISHVDSKSRYNCEICHREFKDLGHFKRHKRIHSNDFPYECPQCDKKFRFSAKLKTHIRTHTGEKPFKCLLCSYRCGDNSNMCKHMRQKHGTTKAEVLQRQRSERE